jgi:hypothetical protein
MGREAGCWYEAEDGAMLTNEDEGSGRPCCWPIESSPRLKARSSSENPAPPLPELASLLKPVDDFQPSPPANVNPMLLSGLSGI